MKSSTWVWIATVTAMGLRLSSSTGAAFGTAALAVVAGKILTFLIGLSGAPWVWFFVAAFGLMVLGAGLIIYAKFPVYRSGRFFTFGFNSLPQRLLGFYRWGWRLFLFGAVLGLFLLWSRL